MEREQTTIRLPSELMELLRRQADREGQSLNAKIITILRKGLELE